MRSGPKISAMDHVVCDTILAKELPSLQTLINLISITVTAPQLTDQTLHHCRRIWNKVQNDPDDPDSGGDRKCNHGRGSDSWWKGRLKRGNNDV
jgi:hypothetical protein